MKFFRLFFLAFLALPIVSFSQIKSVRFQAAGLTCSMCSNAINKALRALPNVSNIETDLDKNLFIVSFKNPELANFDELKNKVEGAGFSINKMQVEVNVNTLQIANDTHAKVDGKQFHFVKVKDQQLSGNQIFTLVDKGFLPTKQYKVYAATTQMECIKTGVMASCCKGGSAGRIYHITI
jgi:copper chaperone CopZ